VEDSLRKRQTEMWLRNAKSIQERIGKVTEREMELRKDISTYEEYRHALVLELRVSIQKHQASMKNLKTLSEWKAAAYSLLGIVEWLSNVL
jgi:hypothetical protein